MAESTRQVQSRDPFERFDEAVNDPRLYATYQEYERTDLAPYGRTELAISDPLAHEPVPLFLSDYDDERYQDGEYTFANGGRKSFRASRIVTGIVAIAAAA